MIWPRRAPATSSAVFGTRKPSVDGESGTRYLRENDLRHEPETSVRQTVATYPTMSKTNDCKCSGDRVLRNSGISQDADGAPRPRPVGWHSPTVGSGVPTLQEPG